MDVLSQMLLKTSTGVNATLTDRLKQPFYLFQYANDALIFSSVHGQAIHSLKLALQLFSQVSGLQINFSKSSIVPLNLSENTVLQVTQILECDTASLPVTYLGLPLTNKRPD
ncbi:hypothetical protein LUZ61_020804 [Rhynchospora tenuis]|uniref:Reverse transcriptase domain-containing protein n=1 Tax=Rhynchospora tenuis TaxID=198213 RepID=A0AAD5ZE51_9POAL|nr:hypothetical protein LUZ61_020804 [Rhynchospora tenuis]